MQIDSYPERVPDFLIVGAARSGTTTLYYQLREHPRVFMPDLKEPFSFTFLDERPPYSDLCAQGRSWTLGEYTGLFSAARPDQLLGEASTSYLYLHAPTIRNLLRVYGRRAADLRILGVLRDPIERTFSNYLLLISNSWDDLTFDQYLDRDFTRERLKLRWDYDYIGLGSYSEAVAAYRATFPHTRFFLYEDLDAPERLLGEVWPFLGLAPLATPANLIRSNPAGIPRSATALRLFKLASRIASPLARRLPAPLRVRMAGYRERMRRGLLQRPSLREDQRARLAELFREDVQRLAGLLGRDLSHWLAPGR